jgi:hypothetical protein
MVLFAGNEARQEDPMLDETPYRNVLAISERVSWELDDVFAEGTSFDFACDFLPDGLARTKTLLFLNPAERTKLNQIRAHAYLSLFGVVEEFILPFVLDHVRSQLGRGDVRTRALLQFASEEAKHIHLFRRFRSAFEKGFGQRCEVIGPPEAIAQGVLGHGPLGVALAILHIEWMTQRHYVEAVKGTVKLEPAFARLLESHWVEESQHARLDAMIVRHLAEHLGPSAIDASIDEYLAIIAMLDAGLQQQVELDLQSLERAIGRALRDDQRDAFRTVQRSANRATYLVSGLTHPQFLAVLDAVSPAGAARVRAATPKFS